jgi:hypothetical protein
MANGMTRVALTKIQLKKESGQAEMNEEMVRLQKAKIAKIPLKNPSEHNHSK